MKTDEQILKTSRLTRIRAQGYCNISDAGISRLAFGNRFTYYICSTLLLIGVAAANIPILSIMMVIALFGIVLPNHPFDYIYNSLLADRLNKPMLPRRSNQLKFACLMATIWLAITIYLFSTGAMLTGYIMGLSLFFVAILVSTTDFCIPSLIYNTFFKYEIK